MSGEQLEIKMAQEAKPVRRTTSSAKIDSYIAGLRNSR